MSKPGLTPAEEQQKLFEEASNVVSVQGFYMKRCLDNNKIMEALKHASNMICELRTGLLTPKNYYALYMSTFDQLRHLEQYLADGKHGRRMTELYELVQYAGNILPRLYLLITVGSVYIKSREAPAKDVLIDLVEMCRGVQHPMRGLFLRTYLSEMTKDKLPDVGNVYAESGGSVRDSIEFSLQNFTEMNKLWVRLQHHGPPSQRARREDERKDLRLLIGKNLSRLSQLDGVTVELYQELVLHRLLEQVVSCRDVIAQQYLMESLIQVFPDHFHLATLDTVLGTCAQLQPAVDVRVIVSSLIDRLAEYAARADGNGASAISEDAQVFNAFYACVNQLAAERPTMLPADLFALHCSLVGLALNSYTDQPAFVDKCLEAAATYLDQLKSAERLEEAHTDDAIEQLLRLLKLPREAYTQLDQTLSLTAYSRVAAHLPFKERRDVAMAYAKAAVSRPAQVSEPAAVTALFANVVPLLRDADDMPTDERLDDEDFAEEQNLVAGLVHLLHDDDPSRHFTLLTAARKAYSAGGARRLRYTLVPIVFAALAVARRQFKALDAGTADSWSEVGKKSMEFVHATISGLAKTEGCAELALRLFLTASLEAGRLGFESVAYEFVARAFSLYEELAKAEEQAQAITLIIATIQRSTAFGADNNDTLVAKSAQYAAKLLLKQAQARAVYLVSHLFWKKGEDGTFEGKAAVQDGKRVLECLQRSLKIADNCMESNVIVQLFVEILNRYLYYFEGGNEAVLPKYIAGLVALINTNIANMDAGADNDQVKAFYANTLAYIAAKKRTDDNFSSKLGDVDALTGEK